MKIGIIIETNEPEKAWNGVRFANTALKKGCLVALGLNPLNEKSINEYIPILKERGVAVVW